jgi:RNA polymerase sigma-70 factor (ECF subfamily)
MRGPETFVTQRRLALFDEQRPRLMGIAYRILGALTVAQEVVDETRRRWSARHPRETDDTQTVLTVIVTRLALERLRRERPRREGYAGAWLPEPIAGPGANGPMAPEADDTLSLATLAAMESLSPLERAAFVLRVGFGCSYAEVATALGRREPAVRQLVHRARIHLGEARTRDAADRTVHDAVLQRFLAACRSGALAPLLNLLAPDVVVLSDAGRSASTARRPIVGRDQSGRFILSFLRRLPRGAEADVEAFNGTTGVVVRVFGDPVCALAIRVDGPLVASVQVVAGPAKLVALRRPVAPTALV